VNLLFVFLLGACGSPVKDAVETNLEETVQARLTEDASEAAAQPPMQPTAEQPAVTPPTEEAPPPDLLRPGEPPDEPERTLKDSTSNTFASEKRATQGDLFLNNLFERPFTSQEMVYQPDLDITTVDFAPGEGFFFFTIHLYGMNVQGGGLQGMYAIEFDRTLTGRGDLLVTVKNPAKEWSTEGVIVYGDDNSDVGGPQPVIADAGFNGSGYDVIIEMEGDKVAWARIDPKDGNAVQIALSYALVETPEEFLWGAWADNGLMDPTKFDYNDTMGPTAAGSPIKDKYYPVKALYSLDNTCRLPYGLEQTGSVPGMCKIGIQPVVSDGSCRPICLQWSYVAYPPVCLRWGTTCN
jgi:hypothetical protein